MQEPSPTEPHDFCLKSAPHFTVEKEKKGFFAKLLFAHQRNFYCTWPGALKADIIAS
jgi:hypothetical protein